MMTITFPYRMRTRADLNPRPSWLLALIEAGGWALAALLLGPTSIDPEFGFRQDGRTVPADMTG